MKKYRVSVLRFYAWGVEHGHTAYFDGLKAARAFVPVKLHYCRNAGGFVGYEYTPREIVEYFVTDC